MKNIKELLITSLFVLFTLASSAQQLPKADQAVIANYSFTVEKVNQYMLFEKGFGAANAAEPKYASLTRSHTLDEGINQLSSFPSFVKLAKSAGGNLRDIALTKAALHILFVASDPKRQTIFLKMCDQGYAQKPSAGQMAFANAHRTDLVKWQQQIMGYKKAELLK